MKHIETWTRGRGLRRALVAVSALSLAVAVPAWAGPGGDTTSDQGGVRGAAQHGAPEAQTGQRGTQAGQADAQAGGQQGANTAYMELASARGKITSIDKTTGRVAIESTEGEKLNVLIPPTVASQFNKGDDVQVSTQMTLAESAGTGAGTTGSGATGSGATGSGADPSNPGATGSGGMDD